MLIVEDESLLRMDAVDMIKAGGFEVIEAANADEAIAGAPVYLIMAMSADKVLRMKPQNLLTGLPTRHLVALT